MARAISVKIPTALLIEQIQNRIAEIDEAIANYPTALKQYNIARDVYRAELANSIIKQLKSSSDLVGYEYDSAIRISRYSDAQVEIQFDVSKLIGMPKHPEAPKNPKEKTWVGREYQDTKAVLQKNLKVLQMTTQEEVSGSTYGALLEFL